MNLNDIEPLDLYAKIQSLVDKAIADAILESNSNSQYNVTKIPSHAHNGVDTQKIDFRNLKNPPIFFQTFYK